MRLGFITQLLWERYGRFWVSLLKELDAEICFALPDHVLESVRDKRLEVIPSAALRLAVAQALSLQEVDLLIAPDLNPGEDSARGSGQDPWIASFPEALASSFAGLPNLVAVPATLELDIETQALELLMSLSGDHSKVRRALERHRNVSKMPRFREPRWQRIPGEQETLGVIAQPWLFTDKLLATLQQGGVYLLAQNQLEPHVLRAEGQRSEARLIDTDAEVLGAAHLFGRRGSIDRLLFIADKDSGADAWLESRIKKQTQKALEVRYLQDFLSPEALLDTIASQVVK